MLSKLPIAGTPINLGVLFSGLSSVFKQGIEAEFVNALGCFTGLRYIWTINSGSAAFLIILKALKQGNPQCNEIILPAHTAPSLILAVLKAGLRPVLCDITLDDFNLNIEELQSVITEKTLGVTGVHMFGIINRGLEDLKKRLPDIFVVEDCAQAMGSRTKERQVGSLGDISFFSFNRGKNLTTYEGGCIATNSADLAKKISAGYKERLENQGIISKIAIPFKLLILSLAVRPFIYGLGYPLISRFKNITVPDDFEVKKFTSFQAGIGLAFLEKIKGFCYQRFRNGMFLIEGLKDIPGIILPGISADTFPAFNRLPVVFEDLSKRQKAESSLFRAGIETSRMYFAPLHHIFALGYKREDFPNATYFANHLLTLPVHPLLKQQDLEKMVELIRQI